MGQGGRPCRPDRPGGGDRGDGGLPGGDRQYQQGGTPGRRRGARLGGKCCPTCGGFPPTASVRRRGRQTRGGGRRIEEGEPDPQRAGAGACRRWLTLRQTPEWPSSTRSSGDRRSPPGGADEVGNKGRNLMRMARAGLPVPPASVLPTAWCGRTDAVAKLPEALARGVRVLEDATRHAFGGAATAAGVCALRRGRLDAQHDGDGARRGFERPDGRGAHPRDRQSAPGLGQL